MNIIGHTVEELHDPTGILVGDRYEFFLQIEIPEDDELYSEHGLDLRIILAVDENGARISQYNFVEQGTNRILEFALEEDEENIVIDYCKQHI
ncbi:DUF6509 family protein [Lederbergia lenta]|uniref:Pullulanase n=1 Tax=Lederbergia lenta TaxID=1467 RepID=A0A2X4Z263_LEDLE|nr:DUF6509 family protein [Lederbergia lenta]MCM3109496.1 DUF6509 family protein [Lederbergia lenta]MEC2324750.1 DUF6509 family protein [Lederbergia lenta]SQI58245.1 Uncharacterised protein [Lederbergia lenta]